MRRLSAGPSRARFSRPALTCPSSFPFHFIVRAAHTIWLDAGRGELFCRACGDYVYDPAFDRAALVREQGGREREMAGPERSHKPILTNRPLPFSLRARPPRPGARRPRPPTHHQPPAVAIPHPPPRASSPHARRPRRPRTRRVTRARARPRPLRARPSGHPATACRPGCAAWPTWATPAISTPRCRP